MSAAAPLATVVEIGTTIAAATLPKDLTNSYTLVSSKAFYFIVMLGMLWPLSIVLQKNASGNYQFWAIALMFSQIPWHLIFMPRKLVISNGKFELRNSVGTAMSPVDLSELERVEIAKGCCGGRAVRFVFTEAAAEQRTAKALETAGFCKCCVYPQKHFDVSPVASLVSDLGFNFAPAV